nr:carbonic anhydrase [Herbaspirillum sp. RV1423]
MRDPDFFKRIAEGQQPDTLWISCADSRVPAEKITHSSSGELFVHRNIANLIAAEDINAIGVIEYAVKVLKVSHIIVCGHYQCGGVMASMRPPNPDIPAVNQHIAQLRRLALRHQDELAALPTVELRADRLAELNVLDQIDTLSQLPIVLQAQHSISLHGWIFGLNDGLLRVLYPGKPAETEPVKGYMQT